MATALDRQLSLLALLAGSRKPLSQDQVFERLPHAYPLEGKQRASARKAFARDLETLQGMGAAILAQEDDEGAARYKLMPGEAGLAADFTLSAAEALRLRELLARGMVSEQLSAPARQALGNLLCFHAAFDEKGKGEEAPVDDLALRCEKLAACAREGKACGIEYPDHDGKPERRVVSPAGIFFRFGKPYLAAVCHRDQKVKAFSVTKLSQVRLAREAPLAPPDGFDLAAFSSRNAFRLSEQAAVVRASLTVLPEAAWRLKERTPWAVVSESPAGVVHAVFEVSAPERFYKFVLGFGEFAEISGPPELRRDFARFLGAAL